MGTDEERVERERFLADVAAGTADLDTGRTLTTDELKRRLGLGGSAGGKPGDGAVPPVHAED